MVPASGGEVSTLQSLTGAGRAWNRALPAAHPFFTSALGLPTTSIALLDAPINSS